MWIGLLRSARYMSTGRFEFSSIEFQVIVASDDQEPKTKTSKEAQKNGSTR